jgi:hypothetical protein
LTYSEEAAIKAEKRVHKEERKARAEITARAYQEKLKTKGYPAGDIAESLSLPEEVVSGL